MDSTPYALAYSEGAGGGWAMTRWVMMGGGERLRHLALMRASSASRRFLLLKLLGLAFGLTAFHLALVGWRETDGVGDRDRAGGWTLVASSSSDENREPPGAAPRALWWNPRIAGLAAGVSFATALLALATGAALLSSFAESMHSAAYRGEGRMSAAIHYGTAWLTPVSLGGGIMLLYPVARASEVGGWGASLPSAAVLIVAGVVGSVGALMGWFLLVRLGATAPVKCRARLTGFMTVAAPALLGGLMALWHFGLMLAYDQLTHSFGWQF